MGSKSNYRTHVADSIVSLVLHEPVVAAWAHLSWRRLIRMRILSLYSEAQEKEWRWERTESRAPFVAQRRLSVNSLPKRFDYSRLPSFWSSQITTPTLAWSRLPFLLLLLEVQKKKKKKGKKRKENRIMATCYFLDNFLSLKSSRDGTESTYSDTHD